MGSRSGAGQPEAHPRRQASTARGVDRRVGDDDTDTRPGRRRCDVWRRTQAAAHRNAGDRESIPAPEVGQHECRDDVAVRQQPRRGPDAAFPAEAGHARAGADGAEADVARCKVAADRAPRGGERRRHVVVLHVHAAGVVEPRVVAFTHDRDDHVVDSDPRLLVDEQAARRVVDPTDLHGRGEEDRSFRKAPLVDLRATGQLACAVEDRHSRRDGGDP